MKFLLLIPLAFSSPKDDTGTAIEEAAQMNERLAEILKRVEEIKLEESAVTESAPVKRTPPKAPPERVLEE